MTKRNAKDWAEVIAFWGNGGNLWFYDQNFEIWVKYDNDIPISFNAHKSFYYVMEDQHFKARKADALGDVVEFSYPNSSNWQTCSPSGPLWDDECEYRPKKREWYDYASPENPILCWTEFLDGKRTAVEIVGYEEGSMNPFFTVEGRYNAFTRPVTPDECFQV